MRHIFMLFLIVILMFSGCASNDRLQYLENKIMQLEAQNNHKWDEFSKKYTPQMRDELSKNLKKVISDSKRVAKLKTDVQNDSDTILLLLNEINRDMKDLRVQNVINEFRALKGDWGNTLNNLEIMIRQSTTNASNAAYSARKFEQVSLRHNNNFLRRLVNLETYINTSEYNQQELLNKIRKLKHAINSLQKSQHSHNKILR